MRHLKSALLSFLLPMFLAGCFTSAALQETHVYKSKDFYPNTIAWDKEHAEFAIVGVRSHNNRSTPCHVVVPEATLLKLKSGADEIRLSDLKKLSSEEVHQLRLIDGPPPPNFVILAHEPAPGVVLNQGRTVFRPTPLLLLPATIVIDVVTLPVALPLLHSLDNVH